MKKLSLRKFYPSSLGNRLYFSICVVGIILVIALGTTISVVTGEQMYNSSKELLISQSKQAVNAFDQYMDILGNTAMTAGSQLSIQRLFNQSNSLYEDFITYRDAYSYIRNVHEFFTGINVYILIKDKYYMMSSNAADITGDYRTRGIEQEDWFQALEAGKQGITIQPNFLTPTSREPAFSYAYAIRNTYTWDTKGYVIATLDKSIMQNLLNEVEAAEDGIFLIVTPTGEIAYNSAPRLFPDEVLTSELYKQLKSGDKYVNENQEEYIYSSCSSPKTGWNFIVLSNTAEARRQLLVFQLSILGVVLGALILLFIMARVIAKMYTYPIYQVIDFIGQTEKNEFAVQCNLQLDGELNDLVQSYNGMVVSVRQNQILRKKAEIDALQKQIDPHFLFNTFASIKVLMQQNNVPTATSMLENLGDLFRYNMNRGGGQTARIKDEVAQIKSYLEIQQVRYGDRLIILYEIDNEILPYETLKFILQPIVENSITHSMEAVKRKFTIQIAGCFQGDAVVFSIRDNGVGMDAATLAALRTHVMGTGEAENNSRFGIGLKNIQERIVLFYGKEYGLIFDSESGTNAYTEIKVRIPKLGGIDAHADSIACDGNPINKHRPLERFPGWNRAGQAWKRTWTLSPPKLRSVPICVWAMTRSP